LYYVYVKGGLYATENLSDLDSLPEISGDMQFRYPEIVQIGRVVHIREFAPAISLHGTLSTVLQGTPYTIDMFPMGDQADVVAFVIEPIWELVTIFSSSVGPVFYWVPVADATIVGGDSLAAHITSSHDAD
jgi:hypothetical protein